MQHVLAGAYYVPLSDKRAVKDLKKALTVKVWTPGEDEPEIVHAWSNDRKGYIGVPRQYGLAKFFGKGFKDETSAGYELSDNLQEIALRPKQGPWVSKIVKEAETSTDIVAMAHTGAGKTVMSLEVIRRLGNTALVVVDQEFLRDQWINNAVKFLGIDREQIGIVQGDKYEWFDKDIVVTMVQTLYNRQYDKEFYEYFGTVVVDEVHTAGAPQFSKALLQFPAQVRLGVSATPNRRDSLQKVLTYNLGEVKVELKSKHKKSIVRYVENESVYSWYANISPKTGRYIAEIVADGARNNLLAMAVKWLYNSGRDVLAVSDRIEHLENLMALCTYMGIPAEEMGIVSGYTNQWGYAKDPTPPRKPKGLEKGTEYTPVKLQLIKKRTPKVVLEANKESKRIVFATFGMFTKGVDVPRLSGGVDCTPRSQATQVHGRILRTDDGKLVPIWVTVRDVNSFRAEHQFCQRISEYEKSNAEIYRWVMGKGVQLKDSRELKADARANSEELKPIKIITTLDGNNMLQTRSTVSTPKSNRATATEKRTRRKKVS